MDKTVELCFRCSSRRFLDWYVCTIFCSHFFRIPSPNQGVFRRGKRLLDIPLFEKKLGHGQNQ